MQVHISEHLPKHRKIQLGSFYTPIELVNKVHEYISPYLKTHQNSAVVFDSAGGCGAFLVNVGGYDYRIADCDVQAYESLLPRYDKNKIFHTNSLINVRRSTFEIPESAFLIMVGNPPYNDTTSEYRSGEKGNNVCDEDLFDRDLGVSFLKSYFKLKADLVCVLHPLSYLIKETNFNRLRAFKDNYRLIEAEIFSSDLFHGTGTGKFPVLVALYERDLWGMTFEYIRQFKFGVLNSDKQFTLGNFRTTDGYINKYPPRIHDPKTSPLGVYYYTFRDFNALKRNASFITKIIPNGIPVTLENLYKYAYLYALKELFKPEAPWIYGNLSPLLINDLDKHKKIFVSYALLTHQVFGSLSKKVIDTILEYYMLAPLDTVTAKGLERQIVSLFIKDLNPQLVS